MHACEHHKYLLGWYGLGKGYKGTIPFGGNTIYGCSDKWHSTSKFHKSKKLKYYSMLS